MRVEVGGDGYRDLEKALREFSRKVKRAEIIQEVRNRQAYMKPSVKKRWKREQAVRKRRREERRQQKIDKKRRDF